MTGRVFALCALIVSFAIPAAARADVVPVASGSTTGSGSVAFSFTVPAGTDRFLAVGISTASNVTVSSVSFGGQVLTPQQQNTAGAVRSETWSLVAPNPGTANVTVTLSGAAPIVAGATSFAGVDQAAPIIAGAFGGVGNTVANAASFVTNGTVAKDGMFGTIAVSPAAQTGDITTQGSVDLVVADNRWATSSGTIRGAGTTRIGWTGANMSANSGIVWRWTNQGVVSPFAFTWLALKASTGNTPPAVNTPTAANITQTTATLGGTLGSTGGSTITARGVVYCQCADPVIGGAGVTQVNGAAGDAIGPFTVNVAGLTASRTYTYKAFATNALGTGYSPAATFDTLNTAPTANAGGPYAFTEGGSLTLSGTGTDANGDPLTYSWDVNGDGTYDDATGAAPAALTPARLDELGLDDGPRTVTVGLRVSDGRDTTTATAALTIANAVPDATVANGGPVNEGSTTTVSFSAVTDPSSADTAAGFRYAYDFDNDSTYEVGGTTYAAAVTASSATVPASYLADGPGTRTVGMLVMDKDGVGHKYTTTITVVNVAPTGKLADVSVDEGRTATVGLTDIVDPAEAATVHYVYDLDDDGTDDTAAATYADGTATATAALPAALTADGPATRTARVRVIDEDGGSTVHTATVTVGNVAPTATLADVTTEEGTPATVAFTGADDVSAADKAAGFTFEWDVDGDGTFTPGTGSVVVPAPDGPAERTIKGAIIDRDGGRTAYEAKLTTTNAAPTATISGPRAVPSSGATTLTLDIADAGADDVTSVLDWGDGTTAGVDGTGAKTVTHTYSTAGARTVTLLATDSDGAKSALAGHTLTVAAAAAGAPAPASPTVISGAVRQTITGVKVTPRCLRADDLRATIAKTQTMRVRFSLGAAAPVRFTLQRLAGKGGASKCPPARGVKHPDGRRVPGVYRPFTDKRVDVKQGANTVTVAATGRRGKRLAPGTYLLIVESGGVSARTKLWVLAG